MMVHFRLTVRGLSEPIVDKIGGDYFRCFPLLALGQTESGVGIAKGREHRFREPAFIAELKRLPVMRRQQAREVLQPLYIALQTGGQLKQNGAQFISCAQRLQRFEKNTRELFCVGQPQSMRDFVMGFGGENKFRRCAGNPFFER